MSIVCSKLLSNRKTTKTTKPIYQETIFFCLLSHLTTSTASTSASVSRPTISTSAASTSSLTPWAPSRSTPSASPSPSPSSSRSRISDDHTVSAGRVRLFGGIFQTFRAFRRIDLRRVRTVLAGRKASSRQQTRMPDAGHWKSS